MCPVEQGLGVDQHIDLRLPAPSARPSVNAISAKARRWSCLKIGSVGQVSGVASWNKVSTIARNLPSSTNPVSGSNSPRRHHMPVSGSSHVRNRVASSLALQTIKAVVGLDASYLSAHDPSEVVGHQVGCRVGQYDTALRQLRTLWRDRAHGRHERPRRRDART